jgi:hypothetical protein
MHADAECTFVLAESAFQYNRPSGLLGSCTQSRMKGCATCAPAQGVNRGDAKLMASCHCHR